MASCVICLIILCVLHLLAAGSILIVGFFVYNCICNHRHSWPMIIACTRTSVCLCVCVCDGISDRLVLHR